MFSTQRYSSTVLCVLMKTVLLGCAHVCAYCFFFVYLAARDLNGTLHVLNNSTVWVRQIRFGRNVLLHISKIKIVCFYFLQFVSPFSISIKIYLSKNNSEKNCWFFSIVKIVKFGTYSPTNFTQHCYQWRMWFTHFAHLHAILGHTHIHSMSFNWLGLCLCCKSVICLTFLLFSHSFHSIYSNFKGKIVVHNHIQHVRSWFVHGLASVCRLVFILLKTRACLPSNLTLAGSHSCW